MDLGSGALIDLECLVNMFRSGASVLGVHLVHVQESHLLLKDGCEREGRGEESSPDAFVRLWVGKKSCEPDDRVKEVRHGRGPREILLGVARVFAESGRKALSC